MVDRYTKSVLTVIAGTLVVMIMQNLVGPSSAQGNGPQKVQICNFRGDCAGLVSFNNDNYAAFYLPVVTRQSDADKK